MLNLIDTEPMFPRWGQVWQSGVIASIVDIRCIPTAPLLMSMSGNENWIQWPSLWVDMTDNDIAVLPDSLLIAMADTAIAFLDRGFSVLVHCNEGKYRSTYMDMAIHMRAGFSFDTAWELISVKHSIAALRVGTTEQLKRLGTTLIGKP